MSFTVFTRLVKSNRDLLRNKSKYKKLKEKAFETDRHLKLQYKELSDEALAEKRKQISQDMLAERKKRIKITLIGLTLGLVVAIWFFSMLNKYTF